MLFPTCRGPATKTIFRRRSRRTCAARYRVRVADTTVGIPGFFPPSQNHSRVFSPAAENSRPCAWPARILLEQQRGAPRWRIGRSSGKGYDRRRAPPRDPRPPPRLRRRPGPRARAQPRGSTAVSPARPRRDHGATYRRRRRAAAGVANVLHVRGRKLPELPFNGLAVRLRPRAATGHIVHELMAVKMLDGAGPVTTRATTARRGRLVTAIRASCRCARAAPRAPSSRIPRETSGGGRRRRAADARSF